MPDDDFDGDENDDDDHHGDHDDDDDDDIDEHEVVSHDNLMVVWALSAGYCLKFPSFSSFPADL